MSKLTRQHVLALKIQFKELFSQGKENVESSMSARFNNQVPQKNFSPEIQDIFWIALKEYTGDHEACDLQYLMQDHEASISGASGLNSFDF